MSITLQVQPNAWTCTVTAFAMVIGMSVKELLENIGQGDEILWPEISDRLPVGLDRKGHHVQEIIDFCMINGLAVTAISAQPEFLHFHPALSGLQRPLWTNSHCQDRLNKYLEKYSGVLMGTVGYQNGHAIAWCHKNKKVFDSGNGGNILDDLSYFNIQTFYIVQEIKEG